MKTMYRIMVEIEEISEIIQQWTNTKPFNSITMCHLLTLTLSVKSVNPHMPLFLQAV